MPNPISMATLGVITTDKPLGMASLGLFGFAALLGPGWKEYIKRKTQIARVLAFKVCI